MKKLRDLQESFSQHLQNNTSASSINDQVKFNSINNQRRLQIYRNNFKAGLKGALSSVYPVVEKLVGKKFFDHACDEYIQGHPSNKGDLHAYGKQFSTFLNQFKSAQSLDYLPDVADFEWGYHQVFHSADAACINLEKLQQLDPGDYEQIRFILHPARYLLHSQYPILDIWQAHQKDPVSSIQLNRADYYYLIARHELEIFFQRLEKTHYQFLQCIKQGETLGQISTHLFDDDKLTSSLQHLLIQNVSTGNLSGFYIESRPESS